MKIGFTFPQAAKLGKLMAQGASELQIKMQLNLAESNLCADGCCGTFVIAPNGENLTSIMSEIRFGKF